MASRTNPAYTRYGFYALGICCLGLGVLHLVGEGEGLGTVLEAILIGGLSLTVFYTAYHLSDRPISPQGKFRALALSILMTISFALLALAVWLVWRLEGRQMEFPFLLSLAVALGAAVGSRSSLNRVESREQLEQAQELSTLLEINQRVLRHNLRNDLSVVLGYLDRIEERVDEDQIQDDIRIIRTRVESLDQTSERARQIVSIWETETTREFDLGTLVHERLDSFREDFPNSEVTSTLPAECRVVAHPKLPLAITELLQNAAEHNPPGTTISIRVQQIAETDVQIEVVDTGVGIPSSERKTIEMPEETPLSHCEGLGLWLVYWIIQKSDGDFTIKDHESGGTRITLRLPKASAAASS